ncbi:zinc ribbon domain-containing protein [Oligella ureolytica]
MPIYVYRCDNCGLEKELLQKMSDPPLKHCESCEQMMVKQVTAAGFELKGSGWYVTDFRDGGKSSSGSSSTES